MYPDIADGGTCPANALFCDNFEEYDYIATNPPILTELLPSWQQYSFHGYPRVDPSKPFLGKQSAALDTEASSYRFAGFIRQTPDGTAVAPLAHFGRVMVFVKALPTTSQWNILEVNGLLAGSTTELATYGIGGMGPLVNLSYTQRPRQLDPDGGITLRAGGPQSAQENALAKANCTKNATTETFPTAKWVCVEWNFDGANNKMHLWLDGTPQTEVDVDGAGSACVAPAPATTIWQGPAMFTKISMTWEAYGTDSPQQNVWYDEFAMGDSGRIGCPAAQ